MTHIDDMFPSKRINGDSPELMSGDFFVTITEVDTEIYRDESEGWVLRFEETEKTLALNKTNAKTIAKVLGPENENWPGGRISLYRTEVTFGDETVFGVRVRLEAPEPVATDSEIPF